MKMINDKYNQSILFNSNEILMTNDNVYVKPIINVY